MKRLQRGVPILILINVLLSPVVFSQDKGFQDGDRVCFVGNSITMSGSFHHYINLFYATRFPERKITFYNCGISGETAANMLNRVESDILIHQPTWCVLMVGSNDINSSLYAAESKNLPDLEGLKQQALDEYYKNTARLIEELLAAKSKIILEIPCIYDQTGKLRAENYFGSNDALYKCGLFLRKMGEKYGLMVVDYWSITNEINKRVQQKDPAATIISSDRTHPNKYGNLIMAYQFLRTQFKEAEAPIVVIDAGKNKRNKAAGFALSEMTSGKDNISFAALENGLPFPAPDELELDSLVKFTKYFNTRTVQIKNLKPGKYRVRIDADTAAVFSHLQLALGINLSKNSHSPQYRQSAQVLSLFTDYWKIAADLRAVKYVEYQHMRHFENREDINAVKLFFDSSLIRNKESDNFNFFTNMFQKYLSIKPQERALDERLKEILDKIYHINTPEKHFYTIERVKN